MPSAAVKEWRYVRSEHPTERLIHFTAEGTRYCFHKHGQHKNNNVMVTVDLLRGEAWQRCWDKECVHVVAGEGAFPGAPPSVLGGELRAKHVLTRPPADDLPDHLQLHRFEVDHGLITDTAEGVSSDALLVD